MSILRLRYFLIDIEAVYMVTLLRGGFGFRPESRDIVSDANRSFLLIVVASLI